MKFSKEEILNAMNDTGIIPVFYHADVEAAKAIIESCYKGGIRVVEFTNRGANALAVFTELVKYVEKFSGLILGIGTIMNSEDAEKFITAGAQFVVSPMIKIDIATTCKTHDKLWMPGCATLTEIVTAKEAGAELIKIFPGFILGPKFIPAVLSVLPGIKLMPTGGVAPTFDSLKAWFDAGVFCVGLGSHLISTNMVEHKLWPELEHKIKDVIRMMGAIRARR